MIGYRFVMGPPLKVRESLDGLRDRKFVLVSLVAGFVIGPGVAFMLAILSSTQVPRILPAATRLGPGDGYCKATAICVRPRSPA